AVTNGKGETVTIPYYEDASGKRYFITAHLWYLQRRLAISGTETLAASDPLGAARLLYRFAQAYEGYNPTADAKWFNLSISRASGPPYSYFGGLWNRWWVDDLLSLEPLLRAYKIVKGTDAFEQLSDALGEDVEQKLVEGLFRPSIDQVMTHVPRYGNLSDNNWSGLVTAARALDEPDYIHLVVSQVEEFLSGSFLSDGFWHEVSLSYHQDLVSGIAELAESLKGWSDTPGYVSPRTGRHLENLDVARDFPIIGRSLELLDRVTYPDGKQLPLQDAWADRRSLQPQADRSTLLLPAAKIARLSGGEGAKQTQIYMNFDPKYGNHYHRDPLNLNLYAQGQELLPDLGYTHTIYHYYANSTIGHNTVVVDGKNMEINDASKQGGNVQAFIPEDGAFGLMRADYASAYSGLQTYSREPWFVPFADGAGGEGYVLDLFRVTGGSRHEYTLQGDANRDAHFETALPLAAYGPYLLPPGTEVVEPIDQTQSGQAEGQYPGYIYVRDVLQAELPGDRYEVTLVTEENESEQAKLRVTGLLEPGSNELYLGRSPSLRATRLNGPDADNNDTAKLYDLPKLVLRREGTNLQSTFATVLEPYRGAAPRIEAIERLQPQQSAEGATAVKIVYDGTTDILLSNPLHPEQPLIVDDIVLRGETGFIRMVDGEVREMRLVGGTLLKKGERELTGQGAITGVIGGTLRQANGDLYDALVTDTAVGEEAVGRYVIVTQSDGSTSGYEIGEVRREQGRTLLVLVEQDPGFEVRVDGSTQQIFYPQRQWNGEPTFRIANAEQAVVHPGDSAGDDLRFVSLGAPRRHLTQGSTVQLSVYGLLADGGAANLTEADIVFASSAPEVLAVDGQGNVTALAEGTAVLSVRVTLGGWTKYAGLMLSSQHEAGSTELLKPPALAVSNEPVFAHETAEIAFADNAVWRAGITGVTVNGRSVSQDVYSVSAGKISFAPGVFAEEGSYWITVRSSGYEHATVGQPIASEVSLGVLTVGSGVLRPTFSSGTTDYTTTVDSAVYGLNVTAAALRADAVLSVGEHVYGNGLSTHVNLHNGWNMLPIRVEAPNGSAKTYTLSILRETGEAATGTVTGTVYDPAGAPVPAAVVRLTGNMSVAKGTGADGSFALEHVPEGWQRLTATHPGYARTVSEAVYVSADRHTSV
ncbi:MAG: Heparinase II/III-like protein, partial [Paenibacillus sp.]|nr:Heparinase II/III-like protein [Paenibacillus sp.]